MKKALGFFIIITLLIFVMGFIQEGIVEKKKIKNFSVLTKGAYLITTIREISVNSKTNLNNTPLFLKNQTKIKSGDKSGGLIILDSGEEIGFGENSSLQLITNKKIELIAGSLFFFNSSNDSIFLKWKDFNFLVRNKAFFSVKEIPKRKRVIENQLLVKVYRGSIKANINGKTLILIKQFFYTINNNGIVSTYKMLAAPTLREPENSKNISIEEGSNLLFKWNQISKARGYNFYFSYNPIFIDSVLKNTNKTFVTLNITDFKESPVYWKVCSVDSRGREGECSKKRRFYIKNLIQILQLWKNPPLLKIEEPLTPTGNLVIIKGKTDLGVNLTINGEEVTIDSSGKFMHILKFDSIGEHQIKIVARNLSGAQRVYTKNVIIYEK